MSSHHRLILSEWRTVMISQTVYPLMFQSESSSDSMEKKFNSTRRILTKWQDQVRLFSDQINGQWYVIREWTEVEI